MSSSKWQTAKSGNKNLSAHDVSRIAAEVTKSLGIVLAPQGNKMREPVPRQGRSQRAAPRNSPNNNRVRPRGNGGVVLSTLQPHPQQKRSNQKGGVVQLRSNLPKQRSSPTSQGRQQGTNAKRSRKEQPRSSYADVARQLPNTQTATAVVQAAVVPVAVVYLSKTIVNDIRVEMLFAEWYAVCREFIASSTKIQKNCPGA